MPTGLGILREILSPPKTPGTSTGPIADVPFRLLGRRGAHGARAPDFLHPRISMARRRVRWPYQVRRGGGSINRQRPRRASPRRCRPAARAGSSCRLLAPKTIVHRSQARGAPRMRPTARPHSHGRWACRGWTIRPPDLPPNRSPMMPDVRPPDVVCRHADVTDQPTLPGAR